MARIAVLDTRRTIADHWHLMSALTDTADAVQSFATAGAIVVGGVFTYYKFLKDRIYRPRLDLGVDCQRVQVGGQDFALCRFSIGNKGSTKLSLKRDGTAMLLRPGAAQAGPLKAVTWNELEGSAIVAVFRSHEWIESSESIHDEQLVAIAADRAIPYKLELRIVVGHPSPLRTRNITISSAKIMAGDAPAQPPGQDEG